MRRLLASITLGLALLWGQTAIAAIGNTVSVGLLVGTPTASVQYLPLTADVLAGSLLRLAVTTNANTTVTTTDSASNGTYSKTTPYNYTGADYVYEFYISTTVDLPAPCTVTATETSTTLVVASVGTCTSADVITVGQTISTNGFTGVIASTCTLVAGAGTCTITGGATITVPASAQINSAIKFAYTGSISIAALAGYSTGAATTSPLDATGTGATGTTSPASASSGVLVASTDIVDGILAINGTNSAYTANSPFTNNTTRCSGTAGNPNVCWDFDNSSPSTSGVTDAPSWTTNRTWGAQVNSFKVAGGAVVTNSNLTLLGVGQ